jgi:adenylate kinase family enzyme
MTSETAPTLPTQLARTPHTALEHFKFYFFAAVLRLLGLIVAHTSTEGERSQEEEIFTRYPFLLDYIDELAHYGLEGKTLAEATLCWMNWLQQWDDAAPQPLPLSVLRAAAGLDAETLLLLFVTGLSEEDARFAALFSSLQGGPQGGQAGEQSRPSLTLLGALAHPGGLADGFGVVKRALNRLHELGLVEITNPAAPRLEWAYQPNALLWDALHGDMAPSDQPAGTKPAPWCRCLSAACPPRLDELGLPAGFLASVNRLPALVAQGEIQTIVLRGPHNNDRRAVLQALAAQTGRGVLLLDGFAQLSEERWRYVGALASLTGCMPVVAFDLAAGEHAELPELRGYAGPMGVAIGRQGGLTGPRAERLLALNLDLPEPAVRRSLWQARLADHPSTPAVLNTAAGLRLTRGSIRRAAQLAVACAALDGRQELTPADVQQAIRLLNRQALETLAHRLDNEGSLSQLAVGDETRQELNGLLSRIHHREQLADNVGPSLRGQINPGVRALFSGPSGSGKTLAARLLAAELNLDIYRIDLSSVVNKYIGETEKNLSRVFARAEELDVVLLLDEGDSLLTNRTAVNNANDRYANLETNYLLQRIETFQGILIVTTNASERIDQAFQRRMDVVVEFHLPDPAERWEIWQSHLPENQQISAPFLSEVVVRCALSGAQIRNAVLHVSLLALQDGSAITDAWLNQALQREYRKIGATCPIKFQEALPSIASKTAQPHTLTVSGSSEKSIRGEGS